MASTVQSLEKPNTQAHVKQDFAIKQFVQDDPRPQKM
jgi:hypothetical protein